MLWKASDIEFTCRLNLLVLLHTMSSSLNPNHNSTYKCRLGRSAQNQPWLEARELPKPQVHLFSFDIQSLLAFSDFLTPPSCSQKTPFSSCTSGKAVLPPGTPLSELVLSSVSVLLPGHASVLKWVSRADSGYLLI